MEEYVLYFSQRVQHFSYSLTSDTAWTVRHRVPTGLVEEHGAIVASAVRDRQRHAQPIMEQRNLAAAEEVILLKDVAAVHCSQMRILTGGLCN